MLIDKYKNGTFSSSPLWDNTFQIRLHIGFFPSVSIITFIDFSMSKETNS